jgi:hypothetical protein
MKPLTPALVAIFFSSCASPSPQLPAIQPSTEHKALAPYHQYPKRNGQKRGSVPRIVFEFQPVLDDDGNPSLDKRGQPITSYIPEDVFVDENNNIEIRSDVVIRTIPPMPNADLGTLTSSRGAVDTITPRRVVLDATGRFRATVSTKEAKGAYYLRIQ